MVITTYKSWDDPPSSWEIEGERLHYVLSESDKQKQVASTRPLLYNYKWSYGAPFLIGWAKTPSKKPMKNGPKKTIVFGATTETPGGFTWNFERKSINGSFQTGKMFATLVHFMDSATQLGRKAIVFFSIRIAKWCGKWIRLAGRFHV